MRDLSLPFPPLLLAPVSVLPEPHPPTPCLEVTASCYQEVWFSVRALALSEALPKQLREQHFPADGASSDRSADCHRETGLMENVANESKTRKLGFSLSAHTLSKHRLPQTSMTQLEEDLKLVFLHQTLFFLVVTEWC